MNDVATQIETNTKTMMILFDERKEMILKLMAMVEELQPIVVKQHEAIQILAAEIVRLRADKAHNPTSYRSKKTMRKPTHSKLRLSQHVSGRLNSRILIESRLKEEVEVLRNELHRAEIELEDRCWVAPTVLQHWLQLTYELELQTVSETS